MKAGDKLFLSQRDFDQNEIPKGKARYQQKSDESHPRVERCNDDCLRRNDTEYVEKGERGNLSESTSESKFLNEEKIKRIRDLDNSEDFPDEKKDESSEVELLQEELSEELSKVELLKEELSEEVELLKEELKKDDEFEKDDDLEKDDKSSKKPYCFFVDLTETHEKEENDKDFQKKYKSVKVSNEDSENDISENLSNQHLCIHSSEAENNTVVNPDIIETNCHELSKDAVCRFCKKKFCVKE